MHFVGRFALFNGLIMECVKVKYASKKMADEDIERIRRKSNRGTIPIRSYQCTVCAGKPWHLTSKADKFKYTKDEMEDRKRILELTEEVRRLKEEIASLKSNTHLEINKEVKTDAKVMALNDTIKNLKKSLLLVRKDNSELIAKIVQLEKLVKKDQVQKSYFI